MSLKDSPGRRRRQSDFKLRAASVAANLGKKRKSTAGGQSLRSDKNFKNSLRRLSKSSIAFKKAAANQLKGRR